MELELECRELLTQSEMADRLGVSLPTMSRQIAAHAIVPDGKKKVKVGNHLREVDAYSMEKFLFFKEEEEMKKKITIHNQAMAVTHNLLEKGNMGAIIQEVANEMDILQACTAGLAFLQKAVSGVQELQEMIVDLENKNYALEQDLEEANLQIGKSKIHYTVEGWSVEYHSLQPTTSQCGRYTSYLKRVGEIPKEIKCKTQDGKFPATVWHIDILEKHYNVFLTIIE